MAFTKKSGKHEFLKPAGMVPKGAPNVAKKPAGKPAGKKPAGPGAAALMQAMRMKKMGKQNG